MGLRLKREKTLKLGMKISELLVSWWWKLAASVCCPWKVVELKRPEYTTENLPFRCEHEKSQCKGYKETKREEGRHKGVENGLL